MHWFSGAGNTAWAGRHLTCPGGRMLPTGDRLQPPYRYPEKKRVWVFVVRNLWSEIFGQEFVVRNLCPQYRIRGKQLQVQSQGFGI